MSKQIKKKGSPQATMPAKFSKETPPVEETKTTTAEVLKEVPGKITFGLQGLQNPTPVWATYFFWIQFVVNKVLIFWLTGTTIIHNPQTLKEDLLALAAIDLGVWTFARFVGVKKPDL